MVFNAIKDQIMGKCRRIKNVIMQNESFIESYRENIASQEKLRQTPRRSRDGSSATKNHVKHFLYKLHKLVNDIEVIEKLLLTPKKVIDSGINLSILSVVFYW